jgi:hypothetical protein
MLVPLDGSRVAVERGKDSTVSEPKVNITDADLELLLVEGDREDPFLAVPRETEGEPRESLDSQILAGLVSP